MPIVISYNDVQTLGALAYQGGYAQGSATRGAQDRQLAAQQDASRDATAARLQQIDAGERSAQADRQLRGDLAGADRRLRYDQLAAQEEQNRARLDQAMAEAGLRAQTGVAQELLGAQSQRDRDERLHRQDLEIIEAERRAGKYRRTGGASGAAVSPEGVPNPRQAEQEVQQHGHLIPYSGQGSGSLLAGDRDRKADQAGSMAALPTETLRSWVASRPDDPWAPFVRAVIQSRETLDGAGGQRPTGALSEGPIPGAGGYTGGRGPGNQADPRFSQLTDQQLRELAENPALLQQFTRQ